MRGSKARRLRRIVASSGVDPLPSRPRAYQRILRGTKTIMVQVLGAPLNPDGTLPEREVTLSMFQIIGPEGRRLCRYVKKVAGKRRL